MSAHEMFVSCARATGDLAGVFEHDGTSGYFYYYDRTRGEGGKVLGAIHVLTGTADFEESDVEVRWDREEARVGLFIRGTLWAVFTAEGKYGGGYRTSVKPMIPSYISSAFNA